VQSTLTDTTDVFKLRTSCNICWETNL